MGDVMKGFTGGLSARGIGGLAFVIVAFALIAAFVPQAYPTALAQRIKSI